MVENFSEWFHNIIETADIIDPRYPIKGMGVWLPYGFQIRKNFFKIVTDLMDKEHDETSFPLLIPEEELAKEGLHVKGFEDEVYWVTKGGQKDLNEKLALRPTSETAIYPMFSLWIRSHIDLPIKIYQKGSTFRYETKHTRPMIRVREITSFVESHTAHSSPEEAEEQVQTGIEIYKQIFDSLAVPYLISKRPDWDKFPGADYTMAFDTVFPDGKTLQIGTVHNLGQTFAKTFDITFENKDGQHEYVYQTCYGISDRVIASAIAIHGDEKGLVLPPAIAPVQVVIVPILFKKGAEEVLDKCNEIKDALSKDNVRVKIDDRDIRPGKKFFSIENKGIPLRIELGPRDLKANKIVVVRRDNGEKSELTIDDNLVSSIKDLLNDIHDNLYKKAWDKFNKSLKLVEDEKDIKESIKEGNITEFYWCGDTECGKEIGKISDEDFLGSSEDLDEDTDKVCVHCGRKAKHIASVAKTY
ncbi:proline--tRNA ligase [Methanobrevibacter boviskoreani]|uniref:proline--tRNA ligase n=1 Tax=Methanobrevibacter boviskoreani TaxID=1348249 RepID=UPI0023EFD316|nr:proline--tRNA ligase [Methanobrevibacter boviskoreani]MDD6255980.1 proline--tRNA ligase [Methanobrevibacter boviskoreani]